MTAMAAIGARIKNPMSGIRGAAQLLEENLGPEDKPLARLIRDETDRVCSLVDRMDAFSGVESVEKQALNIHEVLNRVIQLAQNGFGKHVRFIVNFDPSLPAVTANRDQLVQVFLNLMKNACEAAPTPEAGDDFQRLSSTGFIAIPGGKSSNSAADGCHSRQRFRHAGGLETLFVRSFCHLQAQGQRVGACPGR